MKNHTRQKRAKNLTSHLRHRLRVGEKNKRAKTFKTKEGAEAHAKKLGLKKYNIIPTKKTKYKVV